MIVGMFVVSKVGSVTSYEDYLCIIHVLST